MSGIVVAYGTTRGASKNAATRIAENLGVEAVVFNELSIEKLTKANYGIFVISTFGNGQFPSNSGDFITSLTSAPVNLSHLKFALLGLGSSYYPLFCRAGNNLYKILQNAGAQPFLPYVKSDRCEPDYGVGKIEKFITDVTEAMKAFKSESDSPPKFQIEEVNETVNEICPKGFKYAQIIKKELLTNDYSPSMHRYTIQLPNGFTYKAGDQVLIMPENDGQVVAKVLERIGVNANTVIKITSANKFFPKILSMKQLFTQFIDLNCKPSQELFSSIKVPFDNKLQTIAEFLMKYPNAANPLSRFLSLSEVIVPRYYSVASEREGTVDLVVSDVFFGFDNGYYGLATHYLQLETTTRISIRISEGAFEYPSDKSTPLIITALGSGIAPVLSLLEHRKSGGFGPCTLFFGLRSRKLCQPIIDLLQQYEADGVINKLFIAISREEDKIHVTDVMKKNTNLLWEIWKNVKTQFYYCGPESTAQENIKAIMIEIAESHGNMSRTNAVHFWSKHKWNVEEF
ncbi:Iron only hydrogenase large subunit, C-terminal domain containing protein [Histomonas meleagridis]|uniref:Iron only hydrogenase large subunit, C-terminal domain containing protein n=1 Tax=Histomonas meleagridis TaxID=135588 RepID=UPI00355ABEFB|nr:Iron only hydrogenase large subunit, C-terminal domain containing protein [Histomonas meleagridis]KAH0805228.1 Iron only hydrogenase large subunit, C-terminal domain containing protein [Histomonas meleagridis]